MRLKISSVATLASLACTLGILYSAFATYPGSQARYAAVQQMQIQAMSGKRVPSFYEGLPVDGRFSAEKNGFTAISAPKCRKSSSMSNFALWVRGLLGTSTVYAQSQCIYPYTTTVLNTCGQNCGAPTQWTAFTSGSVCTTSTIDANPSGCDPACNIVNRQTCTISDPTICACSGTANFECSSGGRPTCVNQTWECNSGTECDYPKPNFHCTDGVIQCTDDGWACVNNNGTPIIIDTRDEGFHLTGLGGGVVFRFFPNSPPVQISWTDAAYSNGFLALDRDGNGTIDNATELFGNLTPQPRSANPNGFAALAVYDQPTLGGNGNNFIDPGDAVYGRLRVWIDSNHNGVSELRELHTLAELHIVRIGLRYTQSPYVDQFGNRFRYRGSIWYDSGRQKENCYDVFLLIAPGT